MLKNIVMKKVRTLEFYGYDYDSTMLREKDYFPVSKVKELKNMKYIKPSDDEFDTGSTESNG